MTLFGKRVLTRGREWGVGSGMGRVVGDGAAWTWQEEGWQFEDSFCETRGAGRPPNVMWGPSVLCNTLLWTPPERCFPRTDIFHFKSTLAPAFVWWKGWDLWRETRRDARRPSRSPAAETTPLRGKGWDTLPIMGWTLHGPLVFSLASRAYMHN